MDKQDWIVLIDIVNNIGRAVRSDNWSVQETLLSRARKLAEEAMQEARPRG